MDQKILDFLTKERIGCLTTLLKDGSPHAAALHYSYANDPLQIYFSTDNTSRKCEGLLNGEIINAAVVIGFSEEEFKTIQLDGKVMIVKDAEELTKIQAIHYAKYPEAEKWKGNPETVFLKFTPKWWRYSDYKTKPPTFISSES